MDPNLLNPIEMFKIFLPLLRPMLWIFFTLMGLKFVFILLERYVQKQSVKYFLRRHKIELITFITAIVGYLISYIFVKRPDLTLMISIIITLAVTIVIIYTKAKDRDFYFFTLQKSKDREDWLGEGVFEYDRLHDSYVITDSHSGYIFSKCLTWSDYQLSFDFKILKTSVGVILRSTNLSNLVMLQIFDHGIKAHIRVNGFWQAWEPRQTSLIFDKALCLDNWYHASIQSNKREIRIIFFDNEDKIIFDRVWGIPTGHISFSAKQHVSDDEKSKVEISQIPFSINLEFGTVGFRNDGEERAVVKNMLVEKI